MEDKQSLVLEDRKKLTLTCVTGVEGMSDKEVCVLLGQEKLVIKGEGLTVNKLNVEDGNLTVVGENVCSLVYCSKNKAKAGFSKLFK